MANGGQLPPSKTTKPGEGKAIAESAREKGEPKDRMDALRAEDLAGDIRLKRIYARWLLRLLTVQIGIANLGFFLYGFFGVEWVVEPSVMHVWLGATVVEVIGVVYVIARYLFPRRDQPPPS